MNTLSRNPGSAPVNTPKVNSVNQLILVIQVSLSCILSYQAPYLQHTEGVHQSILIIINISHLGNDKTV